jgi:hypothetical protein
MVETFLERIARRDKEFKKKKELRDNKYWKLSPIERIDYDNKLERINKYNYFFDITLWFLKMIVIVCFGFLLLYFVSDKNLIIFSLGIKLITYLFELFILVFIFDVIITFTNCNYIIRLKKELNRRFKL